MATNREYGDVSGDSNRLLYKKDMPTNINADSGVYSEATNRGTSSESDEEWETIPSSMTRSKRLANTLMLDTDTNEQQDSCTSEEDFLDQSESISEDWQKIYPHDDSDTEEESCTRSDLNMDMETKEEKERRIRGRKRNSMRKDSNNMMDIDTKEEDRGYDDERTLIRQSKSKAHSSNMYDMGTQEEEQKVSSKPKRSYRDVDRTCDKETEEEAVTHGDLMIDQSSQEQMNQDMQEEVKDLASRINVEMFINPRSMKPLLMDFRNMLKELVRHELQKTGALKFSLQEVPVPFGILKRRRESIQWAYGTIRPFVSVTKLIRHIKKSVSDVEYLDNLQQKMKYVLDLFPEVRDNDAHRTKVLRHVKEIEVMISDHVKLKNTDADFTRVGSLLLYFLSVAHRAINKLPSGDTVIVRLDQQGKVFVNQDNYAFPSSLYFSPDESAADTDITLFPEREDGTVKSTGSQKDDKGNHISSIKVETTVHGPRLNHSAVSLNIEYLTRRMLHAPLEH